MAARDTGVERQPDDRERDASEARDARDDRDETVRVGCEGDSLESCGIEGAARGCAADQAVSPRSASHSS